MLRKYLENKETYHREIVISLRHQAYEYHMDALRDYVSHKGEKTSIYEMYTNWEERIRSIMEKEIKKMNFYKKLLGKKIED